MLSVCNAMTTMQLDRRNMLMAESVLPERARENRHFWSGISSTKAETKHLQSTEECKSLSGTCIAEAIGLDDWLLENVRLSSFYATCVPVNYSQLANWLNLIELPIHIL